MSDLSHDLSRREALLVAGACACCAFSADTLLAADAAPKVKSLPIGKLTDFSKEGYYDQFAKANKVMVNRLDDRLVVTSAVCTHKGCVVKVQPDDHKQLKCPCHKAEFSEQGTPIAGPAKTALVRYAVKQAADGTITADLTKTFIESKWEDKDAFVPLKKG